MNPEIRIRKRKFLYTIDEKRLILQEQDQTKATNLSIGAKYNVNESQIRKWRKAIDVYIENDAPEFTKQKTLHPGKTSKGEHLEADLCQWIDNSRDMELDLTAEQVAFEIAKLDPEFYGGDIQQIRKWVYPFLVRNGYSIRQKTHIAQKYSFLLFSFKISTGFVNSSEPFFTKNPHTSCSPHERLLLQASSPSTSTYFIKKFSFIRLGQMLALDTIKYGSYDFGNVGRLHDFMKQNSTQGRLSNLRSGSPNILVYSLV